MYGNDESDTCSENGGDGSQTQGSGDDERPASIELLEESSKKERHTQENAPISLE